MENNQYSIVVSTAGSSEEAKKISTVLLSKKLAACIQLLEINSLFHWEGEVQSEPEILMLIKSKTADFSEICDSIIENHSYDVPEVIQTDISNGFSPYLNWISEVTK